MQQAGLRKCATYRPAHVTPRFPMKTRTRFAPSPTGDVHIGNIRAAIFNWLYARHVGGTFLLRVEDTDRARSTDEACRRLLDVMEWLGLTPDEAPLYQSSRQTAHLEAAEQLLQNGHAYRADKGDTGQGEAILFRMPGHDMAFHDDVKGELRKAAADMKDFVIVRTNGTPVFHLANVVDDIAMEVTHVIRGDDHVENTFRHLALYEALGAPPPRFAHLPMIVNAQGKPYSKRDGDAFVGEFRDKGYLPDALFNYLALLGWSPGDDREVMPRAELVEAFTLDRVQASAAQVDLRKLEWMNGEYMRALPDGERKALYRDALERAGLWSSAISDEYFRDVRALMQERVKLAPLFPDQAGFFFTEAFSYDEKAVRKRLLKEGGLNALRQMRDALGAVEPFTPASTEAALRQRAETLGLGAGDLVHPVRVAISGLPGGPGLFDMLAVLGKERVLARIDRALSRFSNAESEA